MLAVWICVFLWLTGSGEGRFMPMADGRTMSVLEFDADGSCQIPYKENATFPNHTQMALCVRTRFRKVYWRLPIITSVNNDYDEIMSIYLYPEDGNLVFTCCERISSEVFFDVSLFVWQHWCVSVNLDTGSLTLVHDGQVETGNITDVYEEGLIPALSGVDQVILGADMCPRDDQSEDPMMYIIGQMADVRLYDVELSDDEMISYVDCGGFYNTTSAPMLTLEDNDFRIFGPAKLRALPEEEVCSASHTVLFTRMVTLTEAVNWCSQLNGTVAITGVFLPFSEICSEAEPHMHWVGAVRNVSSGKWFTLAGNESLPISLNVFSFYGRTQKCLSYNGYFFTPADCKVRMCVPCNITTPLQLRIKGLCEDSLFDRTLIAQDFNSYQMVFHGDRHSRLAWDNNTWVMTNPRHKKVRAVVEMATPYDIPLGRHTWNISGDTCGRKQVVLVLTVCREDQYTCDDGNCIDHRRRCNLVLDCTDHSDELQCDVVSRESDYSAYHPPPSGTPAPLPLNITVNITSIREFSLMAFTISIDASLTIKWRDFRLTFKNLQNVTYGNKLYDVQKVWTPVCEIRDERLGAVDIKHPTRAVFVIREGRPLSGEEVELQTEDSVYSGADNTLMMQEKQTITFLCHLNLQMFPFDVQRCSLIILVHDLQTNFGVMVKEDVGVFFEGERRHLEYYLAAESMVPYPVSHATYMKLELQFHHLYGYYIGNVFVPSFLLVVVCFLVLFFDIKDFTDRIMVSLTSLLVLTGLFAQTSTTIPRTSYLKLVDDWYLALITQDFFIIMALVVVENLRRNNMPFKVLYLVIHPADNAQRAIRLNRILIWVFAASMAILLVLFVTVAML